MKSFTPEQITIAITVYNRRHYIKQAIASALNQTCRVKVMVVEDCGPDLELHRFVKAAFADSIEYIRSPARRGLFGNWNACLELCHTEWISILHDDDFLAPCFVEAMIQLEKVAPGRGLYFGRTLLVDNQGAQTLRQDDRTVEGEWVERGLNDVLYVPFPFAGQLFHAPLARELGGFRETSFLAGDWEMWAKLMAKKGAVQSSRIVAFNREHGGLERGSNEVVRSGRHLPLVYVGHKRVLAALPPGQKKEFDRVRLQTRSCVPIFTLLRYGEGWSKRLLRYHVGLLIMSKPPHWRYAAFQKATKIGGWRFVKSASTLWNIYHRRRSLIFRSRSNACA